MNQAMGVHVRVDKSNQGDTQVNHVCYMNMMQSNP